VRVGRAGGDDGRMKPTVVLLVSAVALAACDPSEVEVARARAAGPCFDQVALLSTGAGSPSSLTCWHPQHRLEAGATAVAAKDVAVLATCRCAR